MAVIEEKRFTDHNHAGGAALGNNAQIAFFYIDGEGKLMMAIGWIVFGKGVVARGRQDVNFGRIGALILSRSLTDGAGLDEI